MKREDILAGKGLQVRKVELPGLGSCHLRDLPYSVWRDKIQPNLENELSDAVLMLVHVVTDENGQRIFNDDDVKELCDALPMGALISIQDIMLNHMGMGDDSFEDAKKN